MTTEFTVLQRLIAAVEPIVNFVMQREGRSEGGVLCAINKQTGEVSFMWKFGRLETKDFFLRGAFAHQQAEELLENPIYNASSIIKFEENQRRSSAAIQLDRRIIAFQGFGREQNEAILLVAAMNAGELRDDQAAAIARATGNQYFPQLKNACFPL